MYSPNNFPNAVMPSRDTSLLHPYVKSLYEKHMQLCKSDSTLSKYQIKAIATLRTTAYQNSLYAKGRTTAGPIVTKARGGSSMHEYGVAYDIGIFDGSKYLSGSTGSEMALYAIAGKLGESVGMFWGGKFTSINDSPHFQYTGNHDNGEALALFKAGKSIDEVIGQKS